MKILTIRFSSSLSQIADPYSQWRIFFATVITMQDSLIASNISVPIRTVSDARFMKGSKVYSGQFWFDVCSGCVAANRRDNEDPILATFCSVYHYWLLHVSFNFDHLFLARLLWLFSFSLAFSLWLYNSANLYNSYMQPFVNRCLFIYVQSMIQFQILY